MIALKTAAELEVMDRANRLVHEILNLLSKDLRPGTALRDLDSKLWAEVSSDNIVSVQLYGGAGAKDIRDVTNIATPK